mmetsp:Transcript_18324/g.50531  ORF Transcript_18324/g.50531 Transcript_18324/m.50531 type:complete len:209 (-) Transcript_18324:1633-2259(-)
MHFAGFVDNMRAASGLRAMFDIMPLNEGRRLPPLLRRRRRGALLRPGARHPRRRRRLLLHLLAAHRCRVLRHVDAPSGGLRRRLGPSPDLRRRRAERRQAVPGGRGRVPDGGAAHHRLPQRPHLHHRVGGEPQGGLLPRRHRRGAHLAAGPQPRADPDRPARHLLPGQRRARLHGAVQLLRHRDAARRLLAVQRVDGRRGDAPDHRVQ